MITLSAAVIFSAIVLAAVASAAPFAHANVAVDGSAYGKSAIIELASESKSVSYFKVWLEDDVKFDSFKSENGWTGNKASDGSVLFTASDLLNPGENAKFGLVANDLLKKISWQAGDADGQIGSGVIILVEDAELKPEPVFRIIPERPHIGSTIRVIGESLPPSADFDFYINNERAGTFTASESGYFAGTAKIPSDLSPGNTEFRLGSGNDAITFSITMTRPKSAAPSAIELTLDKIPDVVHRRDSITLQGTGDPNTRIIIKVKGPDGTLENSLISETDDKGRWSVDPIKIGFDALFGTYVVTVTDRHNEKEGAWNVESDRVMDISAANKILKPGDVIRFTGTVLPNEQIQLAIENPDGNKVGTEIITTNDSGRVEFEYFTSKDSKLGPYTLIATQGGQTEFVHTSLGRAPKFDFNLELDKNTYVRGETMVLAVSGDKSDTLNLRILSEKRTTEGIVYDTQIRLDPEGRGLHHIRLDSNYTEGTYTARLSKGNIDDEEKFGVDLDRKSADLVLVSVKETYVRGETILIIGNTLEEVEKKGKKETEKKCTENVKNIQIVIRLVDPDGTVVRAKPTFIDNNCSVIDRSFKIPDDASLGTWKIVSNIKKDVTFLQEGTFVQTNRTGGGSATGLSYDGCVPSTNFGKLVLLACRLDVDGPKPTPVLRLVDRSGNIVWEGETPLVDSIFSVLNETRGEIQGIKSPAAAKNTVAIDYNCGDPGRIQTGQNQTSQSNQTKIDLLGIKTVACSHGGEFSAPAPACSVSPDGERMLADNSSDIDTNKLGRQTVLYTCGDGKGNTDNATRTVIIVDRTKPVISLTGHTVQDHFLNNKYEDPGAKCMDAADESPILADNVHTLNVAKLGKQKILYTCTDAAGNKNSKIRTVSILDPCDFESYANVRGEIKKTLIGCQKDNRGAGGIGATLVEYSFEVVDIHDKNLRIRTEDGGKVDTGDLVNVVVTGSKKGTVISITYENGRLVHEYTIRDADNEITYHWLAARHMEPGTYKISATYGNQKAETEYQISLR